jgi:hypothetical protein
VRWQKKVGEIVEAQKKADRSEDLKEWRERLELYEQGKPYRHEPK